jgi:hypothetical protein
LAGRLASVIKMPQLIGSMTRLFEGRMVKPIPGSLIVSSTGHFEDSFLVLTLHTAGVGNLKAALDELMLLEEDNHQDDGGHGKPGTGRGMRVTKFPPVLVIQLKRSQDDHKKLSSCDKPSERFEFPTHLDLGPYLAHPKQPSPADEAGGSEEAKAGGTATGAAEEGPGPESFCLHSVLLHSGDAQDGHHYAYVRPAWQPEGGQWFKYEDNAVGHVTEAEGLEDSYGPKPAGERDETSEVAGGAYMLVYIRERDLPMVLRESAPEATPTSNREPRHTCQGQKAHTDERGSSSHATVEVMTEADVGNFTWYTEAMDFAPLRDELTADDEVAQHSSVLTLRVSRSWPVAAVMLHVRRELGIPLYRQRLWVISERENKTWRVSQPLSRLRPSSAHPSRDGEAFLDSRVQDLMEGGQLGIYVEELPELREVLAECSGDEPEPDWLDMHGTCISGISGDVEHEGGDEGNGGDTDPLLRGVKGGLGHEGGGRDTRREAEASTRRHDRGGGAGGADLRRLARLPQGLPARAGAPGFYLPLFQVV